MTPILKNILVKPYPPPEFTEGGLIVPDTVKKPSNKVFVVEVGNACTKVKKGQSGFRVKGWGIEILIDNELHFIMNEAALIAIV